MIAVPAFLVAVSQSDFISYILNAYLEGKGQQNDLNQRKMDLQSKGKQITLKRQWFEVISYMDGKLRAINQLTSNSESTVQGHSQGDGEGGIPPSPQLYFLLRIYTRL